LLLIAIFSAQDRHRSGATLVTTTAPSTASVIRRST
jgi:hypothetical protein